MDRVVFTNETDLWRTERELMRWLKIHYGGFTLDAAASDALIAERYYGPGSPLGDNGLQQPWDGDVFCNPPYSEVSVFVEKAIFELQERETCRSLTLLVGARSDTAWWQESWRHWTEVLLLRSRTRFWLQPYELEAINAVRAEDGKKPISDQNTAPFPSAVLRWTRAGGALPSGPVVRCVNWRAELKAFDACVHAGLAEAVRA